MSLSQQLGFARHVAELVSKIGCEEGARICDVLRSFRARRALEGDAKQNAQPPKAGGHICVQLCNPRSLGKKLKWKS